MPAAEGSGARAIVAVMGATGTGKSTFIKHVTDDESIVIGHNPESETFDVEVFFYKDPVSGTPVMLVDTPGFDDSRDGVTDTDILEKIAAFLQQDGIQKLNGIIYMHRISDPRVGGMSRKNLKMFKELCGDKNLSNVQIVTTNWDRVGVEEGNNREAALAKGAFKSLIDAGAKMARQDNEKVSALAIMSELIGNPAVEPQVVEEMKDGKTLAQTSAGNVLVDEINALQEKHKKEMEDVKKEMEEAAKARDQQLIDELEAERKAGEEKIRKMQEDIEKLQSTRIEELQDYVVNMQSEMDKVGRYAKRGAWGNYAADVWDVIQKAQKAGGIPGAVIGASIAPWVALKRGAFGRKL